MALLSREAPQAETVSGRRWRPLLEDLRQIADGTAQRLATAAYGTTGTIANTVSHAAVTAAGFTLTLPSATTLGDGRELSVKDESGALSSGSPLTLAAPGSETVDGAASISLKYPYAAVRLISRNGNWWRLDNNDL